MSLTHLVDGDFLSSQWAIVIGIGLLFFLVQIVLCVSFCTRLRRHEAIIRRLGRDFEQGGSGRNDIMPFPRSFFWIRWVDFIFPAGAAIAPNNFTREDVMQELDARIASHGDYLLLQRMGVMAPLLGVVLTVAGFYWLNVGNEDQSLQSILSAVTPLIAGVGTGAVLALINQILLHIAGQRVESLRMTARAWFDNVIWNQVGRDAQVTTRAVQAMERFAGSITDAAEQFTNNSKLIGESTTSMTHAASHFSEVVQSFRAEIEPVPDALRGLQSSTAASADALDELIRVGSRAVSNLDVSVAAFRTTLDREFAAAAKLHHRSGEALAETVQQIASYAKTTTQLSEFLAQSVSPMTRQLAEFRETLTDLKKVVDALKNDNNADDDVKHLSGMRAQTDHVSPAIPTDRFESQRPGKPR